ncbi:hypothetical protein [Paenibacillus sp. 1P07SE]|uniref:hypothetical protein n=1 Tax=Paenibacillus sp. 1P07SE TaxID=3132209 RepID=UPI0039A58B97
MQRVKKLLIIAMGMLIVVIVIFAYKNWEMWRYKLGYQPVFLNLIDTVESIDALESGDTFVLKNPSKWIPEMKAGITDFYWVEGSNSLRFGLWYRDWDYKDDYDYEEIFDIRIRDNQGTDYGPFLFATLPGVGVYETFQIREFRGIDIHTIDQLHLDIALKQDPATTHTVEIYHSEVDRFIPFGSGSPPPT